MKAEQLRKSILQMAIQGKLVPQNPDDEPASVLLEKIRAEKQKLINEGKIKKDKNESFIFKGDDNRPYEKVGDVVKDISDELPFEIPDSWEWVRLSTISKVITKGTTPRGGNVAYVDSGVGFLRAENISGYDKLELSTLKFIDQSTHLGNLSRSILKKDDILITIAGTLGRTAIVREENLPLNANQAVSIVRLVDNKYINLPYLVYVLNAPSIFNNLTKQKKITAIPNLTLEIISDCIIPIAPLTEQERIVAEIEKYEPLLAEYNKLEQQATKLDTEIYDKLKKSILQYAIQGKLVPQDPADEPASVLLERIRTEKKAKLGKKYVESYIYKGDDNCYYEHIGEKEINITENIPFDLPNNWSWGRWGEISNLIQYGYNAPAKEKGRIKMVRISDIHNNEVMWNSVPYCDIPEEEVSTYILSSNDILFARTGGTVGKSFLVSNIPEPAIFAGYLIRTQYSKNLIPQYLKYFMESNIYWAQLREGTIATAQPNCNGKTLSKMLIPIPPLAEQQRIVDKINEIFAKL